MFSSQTVYNYIGLPRRCTYHSYSAEMPTSARRSDTAPKTPVPLPFSHISPHWPDSSVRRARVSVAKSETRLRLRVINGRHGCNVFQHIRVMTSSVQLSHSQKANIIWHSVPSMASVRSSAAVASGAFEFPWPGGCGKSQEKKKTVCESFRVKI